MRNSVVSVLLFVMSVLLLASCSLPGSQRQLVSKDRMLEEDVMENIFYEMHVADAMVSLHMVQVDGHTSLTQYQVDSLIYESIYDKYNCTRESFEESILWYLQNKPEQLKVMYEHVVERFNQNIAEIGNEKSDSVATVESNTL